MAASSAGSDPLNILDTLRAYSEFQAETSSGLLAESMMQRYYDLAEVLTSVQ